jgi:hypothetical protein
VAAKVAANANKTAIPDGTYKSIVAKVEKELGLPPGTIWLETIRSRMRTRNYLGTSWQWTSPSYKVEPFLVDILCELARIGEAQTKYEIMELADEIIRGTEHAQAYIDCCEKRQTTKNWDEGIVGEKWYQNFIQRNQDWIKRAKFKVQDSNRRTYCTDNFSKLYTSVYKNTVDAGVSIKLEEGVMFNRNGNITDDPQKMFGRPSRYQITKPERCVFVDETGCHTNCKIDGLIGGQQQAVNTNQTEGGRTSATTDLHYTVLAFTSGTGEPIMCAVILKSDKKIEDVPVNCKLGLDATKKIKWGKRMWKLTISTLQMV